MTIPLRSTLAVVAVAGLALAGCGTQTSEKATTAQPTTQQSSAAAPASSASAPASSASSSDAPSSTTPSAEEDGNGLPSAATLWKAARQTTVAQKSVRIAGTTASEGDTLTMDMRGRIDGSNMSTSMKLGKREFQVVNVGGKSYIKGNAAFWTSTGVPAQSAQKLGSKYVASDKVNAELTPKAMLTQMFSKDLGWLSGASVKVERTTLDGKPAITMADRVSAKGSGQLWLTDDAKAPLPLKMVGTDNDGKPMAITFSEWNSVKPVTAPPASQVVNP